MGLQAMRRIRYIEAINEVLRNEMEADPRLMILGEDIRGNFRGETKGLSETFGTERVVDVPISEAAITGYATGLAITGTPIVLEFQVSVLAFVAFDQIVNQAAKLRFMSGGQFDLPVTYLLMAAGAGKGLGAQHSDNPYPFLVHAGIKTIIPSTPYDMMGLLSTAIRDPDPVAVLAPAFVLGTRGDVPDHPFTIPLGLGSVKRAGKDATVIAVGHLVQQAVQVADELMTTHGIDVEVWDPRSLLPLDEDGMVTSVRKTGRAVVFDDSNRPNGTAAELCAVIAERCHFQLRAAPRRVTRAGVPVPYSAPLEAAVLPNREQLTDAVLSVMEESRVRAFSR